MPDVPSNLIPTRLTQLPVATRADADSLLMIVTGGRNYQIRLGDLISISGVPPDRQILPGTGMTGGGALSGNVTLSIAPKAVNGSLLADTGVAQGVYGDATHVPVITVDGTGRVMAASTVPLTTVGYVPLARQVRADAGLDGGGGLGDDIGFRVRYGTSAPGAGFQAGLAGTVDASSRADHRHPAVDLAADDQVDNILGLSNGGTARSLVMRTGAIIWSGADGLYVGPPGEPGQVLVSGGQGAPGWGAAVLQSDQPANFVYAGPAAGAPGAVSFRALTAADIPAAARIMQPLTSGLGLTGGPYDGSGAVILSVDFETMDRVTGNFTNKRIDGAHNSIFNIANGSLSNSSVRIGTADLALGGVLTTLTGVSISGEANTLTNIPTASLTASSLTIGTTIIGLGLSSLVLAGLDSVSVTREPTLNEHLATKRYVDSMVPATTAYTAGDGLVLVGTRFSLATTGVSARAYGAADRVLTATVNTFGQMTVLADTPIAIAASQLSSGVLPVERGGTGVNAYTSGSLLYASGTSTIASLPPDIGGRVLVSSGAGVAPVWATVAGGVF